MSLVIADKLLKIARIFKPDDADAYYNRGVARDELGDK